MPKKPLDSTKRLSITIGILASLIVLALLTIGKPSLKYEISNQDMLDILQHKDYLISPNKALKVDKANTKFIDLRNKYLFNLGHIAGALNISSNQLIAERNLDLLKDSSITFILYGATKSDANGPWMLLNKIGYSNVKMLDGGYINYVNRDVAFLQKENLNYNKILQKSIQNIAKETNTSFNLKQSKKRKKGRSILKKAVTESAAEEGC